MLKSTTGLKLGTDFCAHNGLIFQEVLSLQSAADLASYVAGKDLVPPSLEVCEVAEAPAKHKAAPAAKHH